MVAYRYDGSFEGFLCCIFESYTKREVPAQIFSDEEAQVSLYPEKWIETDSGHAERVYVSPVSYTHLDVYKRQRISCLIAQ